MYASKCTSKSSSEYFFSTRFFSPVYTDGVYKKDNINPGWLYKRFVKEKVVRKSEDPTRNRTRESWVQGRDASQCSNSLSCKTMEKSLARCKGVLYEQFPFTHRREKLLPATKMPGCLPTHHQQAILLINSLYQCWQNIVSFSFCFTLGQFTIMFSSQITSGFVYY